MSAPTPELDEILEQVRTVIEDAERAGRQRPGRPTIIEVTGLSEHQVKKALEVLKPAGDSSSPDDSPADPDDGPNTEEMPVVCDDEHALLETAGDAPGALDIQDNPAGDPAGESAPPAISSPRRKRPWPLILMGVAAGIAVWSGWVGLGQMTGFGLITPLPGIVDNFQINTSIVLPLSVEMYGAYALKVWLGSALLSKRTRRYAKISSIASLVIGAGAQVAYHLMAAAGITRAPWQITVFVACVPVVVLGLAAALHHLETRDRHQFSSPGDRDE